MAAKVTEPSIIQETQFSQPLSLQEEPPNLRSISEACDADTLTPTANVIMPGDHILNPDAAHAEGDRVSKQHSSHPVRVLAPDLLRGLLMVLQAIDHAAVTSNAWPHGVAIDSEADSARVKKWNDVVPWVARMLTHLCAPGFMFLLGMGVVYFGRSRTKLDWSAGRMTRHFAIRAVVLAGVNQLLTFGIAAGSGFQMRLWVLNIVLLALAVNYFIAGMIWQFLSWTEQILTTTITKFLSWKEDDGNALRRPLLQTTVRTTGAHQPLAQSKPGFAASISWHVHTLVLLFLCIITIFWNILLSPTHGHCIPNHSSPIGLSMENPPQHTTFYEFLFHVLMTPTIVSPFPPLAWLSFAVLGLLYGRIILSRPFRPLFVNFINFLIGIFFLLIFVLTRLLHFGNLSENCLNMPEHRAHPSRNQYLASFRSFFYTIKYPPDVAFMGYTMGINFLFLSLFGFVSATAVSHFPFSILITYGTSALFFYTIHLPIYGALGYFAKMLYGQPVDFADPGAPDGGDKPQYGIGHGIGFWSIWVLGLVILWPLCFYYGKFKRRQGPESIWRFF